MRDGAARPFFAPETAGARIQFQVVRVADTEAVAQKAEQLGGEVRVAPRPTESGSVALLVDPSGAYLIIQRWTAPAAEQEEGS